MRRPRIIWLAELYDRTDEHAIVIGELCDNYLDRSGKLLGNVREVAYLIRARRKLRKREIEDK